MNSSNYFTLLFVVLSYVLSYANSRFRIVKGELSRIEDSPYMVEIYYKGKPKCAGALVSVEIVITAGHCLNEKKTKSLVVTAGVTNRAHETGQRRLVKNTYTHNDFRADTNHMDIGAIKVSEPFDKCSKVNIIPLCSTELTPNTPMKISGWGSTRANMKNGVPELRTAFVPIVPTPYCVDIYKAAGRTLTKTMICAGVGGSDACYGDSGAPGVVRGELCAVVSFGNGCGSSEFPGVYTNITNERVLKFINKVMDC